MLVIKPSFEILYINDEPLKLIERGGRVCYKSEDKIDKDSASKFVSMVCKKNHESVIEHSMMSVLFICDRGVTHEIVRHRLASYSQESTRYCNYTKGKFGNQLTFIEPIFKFENMDNYKNKMDKWIECMKSIEYVYNDLISIGASPQEARSVLPNSLKTEIVMTTNFREWKHFFKMRTSKTAHPQMREVACPLLDEVKKRIPVIFDGIEY